MDCFVALLLAMTVPRTTKNPAETSAGFLNSGR
jgi:hypothetical protein